MKNIIKITAFLSLIFLNACTDNASKNIIPQLAVVEAYLSPNNIIDVLIRKELPFSDTTTTIEVLPNLVVKVGYDNKTVTLKAVGNGHYVSDFKVDSLKTYRLFFDYGGKTVEATTTIPSKPLGFKTSASDIKFPDFKNATTRPEFPELKLTWTNTQSQYHLVVVKTTEASPVSTGIFPAGSGPSAKERRNKPTQDNYFEVRIPTLEYWGKYDMILYRINADYAALYTDSGSNSLNLTSPTTNVKNGLGIFTGVSADTLKLLVRQ
jgi:hypothetical protein